MAATEYVILVNEQNEETGYAEKIAAHQQNLLHRAFSIFIFRETKGEKELLLQQRALTKYHSPGLWTNTCCSHPRAQELITQAGERRLQEEFGFCTRLKSLGWFHYNAHFGNGLSENEIDYVLIGEVTANVRPNPNINEIHDYKWVSIPVLKDEIKQHPNRFTPWLADALSIAEKALNNG